MNGVHRTFKPGLLVLTAIFLLQPSTASAVCPDPTVDALITAINDANNDTAPKMHKINLFPQTTYELSAICQLPAITSKITINGNGATIDGNHICCIVPFIVAASGDLTLNEVIATGGLSPEGGGIFNRGTLTLINSSVTRNTAGIEGGGIVNFGGTVTLVNSSVDHNDGSSGAGGIRNIAPGTVNMNQNSRVTANGAAAGGGIINSGTLNISGNSSVDNNRALDGGGIANGGTVNMTGNSKVTDNHASSTGDAGGILNGGTVNMTGNSSIDHNTALAGGGILNGGTVNMTGNSSIDHNTARAGGGILTFGAVNLSGSARHHRQHAGRHIPII